jgi:AraC family transcriptional regulator
VSVLALGQYFGRVPQRWSAESLTLSPVIHDHRRVNVTHSHQAAFVTVMLGGEYTEVAARKSFSFDRFTAIYHPDGIEHQDFIGAQGVRLLLFEFNSQLLDGVDRSRLHERSLRDLSGSRAVWDLLALYRDVQRDCEPLDFESRALQLIGSLAPVARNAVRDAPRIARAREYLDAHFRERVTMRDIARATGVHPVYLGQLFHRESGETISEYVMRLRVRAAAEQLSATEEPAAKIAFDHGFCDQSHFHRAFKRLSGFAPAAFRRSFR